MAKSRVTKAPRQTKPGQFEAIGSSGLKRWGSRGLVTEEFLPELKGSKAVKIYKEMRDNEYVVGAIMFASETILRGVKWEVRGEDEVANEFVQQCIDDMKPQWSAFISEVLSYRIFGWALHEVIYKRRDKNNSKFPDGKIGWAGWPIRSQDSLYEWIWDESTGEVSAMVQQVPNTGRTVTIPMDRALLFRLSQHKGNPEGRSLLRNAYRPWFFKKHTENQEAIGIERDLAGLPVAYMAGELASQSPGDSTETYYQIMQKIVRNVRRDEEAGLVLPLAYDEHGNPLVKFELLSSSGTRAIDTTKVKEGYARGIAMTMLADWVMLGHERVGSLALADSKTDMYGLTLGVFNDAIAEPINDIAIPRLMMLNGMKPAEMPKVVPGDIETPDLEKFANAINTLAGAGMPLFPDDTFEGFIRRLFKWPAKDQTVAA